MGRLGIFRDRLFASSLYQWTLGRHAPAQVVGEIPDPWPGDPGRGESLVAGLLPFDGDVVPLAEGPWPDGVDQESLSVACHAFGWLRDLRALGSHDAAERGRQFVETWVEYHGRWSPLAWRADVLGARLTAWLAAADFLAGAAEEPFRAIFLTSLARQVRHLRRSVASAGGAGRLFPALQGLIVAGLCLPGHANALAAGRKLLELELERQILPDGGHIQRSPQMLLDVLRRLVEIRALLLANQADLPEGLQSAIDRATPMLRGFMMGDGRLARFNGGGEADEGEIAAVLGAANVRGRPLAHAPHCGFQRLAAGRTLIVLDAGAPPPPGADRRAHAGTLSFEMSVGKQRLVVNCGAHPHPESRWNDALRATAAHSTMVVDDTNSAQLMPAGGMGRRRPAEVTSTRREYERNIWVDSAHDGYERLCGLIHRRNLYLSADGDDLRGQDGLEGPGGQAFALRFHLHPRIQASLVEDGGSILLKPPHGPGWRFIATGGTLGLEESIYLENDGTPHRARQIVVGGELRGEGADVKWRLHKVAPK